MQASWTKQWGLRPEKTLACSAVCLRGGFRGPKPFRGPTPSMRLRVFDAVVARADPDRPHLVVFGGGARRRDVEERTLAAPHQHSTTRQHVVVRERAPVAGRLAAEAVPRDDRHVVRGGQVVEPVPQPGRVAVGRHKQAALARIVQLVADAAEDGDRLVVVVPLRRRPVNKSKFHGAVVDLHAIDATSARFVHSRIRLVVPQVHAHRAATGGTDGIFRHA